MSDRFDPRRGLVVVNARLRGPLRPLDAQLMLDTGSVLTMVRPGLLVRLGFDLDAPRSTVPIVGVTGVAWAPLYVVESLTALDHEQRGLAVLGHAFSRAFPFDGLLGANFFRSRRLTVDYREGAVRLD